MKKTTLIILLIFTSIMAKCQTTANIISQTDFNNMKINNISLQTIKATEGDEPQIQNLFSATIIEKDINTGERGPSNYWFKYDGFEIAFTDNAGTPNHPGLAMFEITKNNWSFTVKGRTVTIGDNISLLGNVIYNTKVNGDKGIIYQYCNGCNNYIGIDFDQNTNEILRIYFIEQT